MPNGTKLRRFDDVRLDDRFASNLPLALFLCDVEDVMPVSLSQTDPGLRVKQHHFLDFFFVLSQAHSGTTPVCVDEFNARTNQNHLNQMRA